MISKLLRSDRQPKSTSIAKSSIAKSLSNLADNPLAINAPKSPGSFADNTPVKSTYDSASLENVDVVIGAAYKQVFGNAHLMESERLPQLESQLRSGRITVKEFVSQLAKSEKYRTLFWDNCSNLKAIELNFKHLLGRTPNNYEEISQHIKIATEEGFEAEIDSYLNSEEYAQNFGTTLVPYYRGYTTQTGNNLAGFIYSSPSSRVASSSDKSTGEIASLKLLIDKDKGIPGTIPSTIPIPGSYPVPVVLPSGESKSEEAIPLAMLKLAREIRSTTTTSTYRRPVLVDKKFIDMAYNTPPRFR